MKAPAADRLAYDSFLNGTNDMSALNSSSGAAKEPYIAPAFSQPCSSTPFPVADRPRREALVWPEGQHALRGVGGDKLPRVLEVVLRHPDLARATVAYSVAGACAHVRLAMIAGDSFRP